MSSKGRSHGINLNKKKNNKNKRKRKRYTGLRCEEREAIEEMEQLFSRQHSGVLHSDTTASTILGL